MNRTTPLAIILLAVLSFALQPSPTRADISYTGEIDPSNLAEWGEDIDCYVGKTTEGMLMVDNDSDLFSCSGTIGFNVYAKGKVTVSGFGSTWTCSGNLNVGDLGEGILNILNGGTVSNSQGYISMWSSSKGIVNVSGANSHWINSEYLYVGFVGNGSARLNILDGGVVSSVGGYLGEEQGSRGVVAVDGVGSKWENSSALYCGGLTTPSPPPPAPPFFPATGSICISGGGEVTALSAEIRSKSLLEVDVGRSSIIGCVLFINNGEVRILAGSDIYYTTTPYSPIAATSWSGGGTYQAVGGTWDGTNHKFYVSETLSGKAGDAISLDLAETQRALVVDDEGDNPTGWQVGASFLHKTGENTDLDFTASVIVGEPLELLAETSGGEIVKGAWEFTVSGDGYSSADPIYLSFAVGAGINRNDLHVWHFVGAAWTAFDAMDLTVNDGWASFTADGLSGYAVTVPEPGTLALLAAALVCTTIYLRRKRR